MSVKQMRSIPDQIRPIYHSAILGLGTGYLCSCQPALLVEEIVVYRRTPTWIFFFSLIACPDFHEFVLAIS